MGKKFSEFLRPGRMFRKEFRRQIRILIVITLGFTIAFTWRQTIFDLSEAFVIFITNVKNSSLSSVLTSVFITLISIILIYATSHYLKQTPKSY